MVKKREDVGHHRIVRGQVAGADVNVVVPEGEPIPEGADRAIPDPAHCHVYHDDWRIDPAAQERAA